MAAAKKQKAWQLKAEWEHMTLTEALQQKIYECESVCQRQGKQLPLTRLPDILAEMFERVKVAE